MNSRHQVYDTLEGIEREYRAANAAGSLMQERLLTDPNWPKARGFEAGDASQFVENLESTYFMRLYAAFEANLRDFWLRGCGRPTEPPMRELLASVATRRKMPGDCLDLIHEIRVYRNGLVHGGEETPDDQFTLRSAHSGINWYLSYLPVQW